MPPRISCGLLLAVASLVAMAAADCRCLVNMTSLICQQQNLTEFPNITACASTLEFL
jgi:hypothetical protein